MKKVMEYRGYSGSVEYSDVDDVYFGKVLGIKSLLLYEGKNVEELERDFHIFVDEYIEACDNTVQLELAHA